MGQVFSCLMKPPFHLPENPRSMSQGLSNEFNKDDVDGFSLLHAEYDDRNLSKLDFKLRSFMDYGRDFTLPAKKPRASTSPLCQVYGCNMDLSSSKDYHKRHRVCETHSKTSVAIVSGTEQRFCQQCSRFHLLSEFDDGKRSFRRSLLSVSYPVSIRTGISFFLKVQTLCLSLLPLMYSRPNFMVVMAGNKFHGSFLMDEQDHKYRARLMSFKDEPTCDAHSLLSAQSQQQFSETPNRSISITRPNQTFSYSTIGYHQMQPPLRTDPGKIKTSTQSTATVIASSENRATTEEFH